MKYFTSVFGRERVLKFRNDRETGGLVADVLDDDGAVVRTHALDVARTGDGSVLALVVDGRSHECVVEWRGGKTIVFVDGERIEVAVKDERQKVAAEAAAARGGGKQTIAAVMPGVVVEMRVAEGDEVEAGQTLAILEAMKMQNPIQAEAPGRVLRVHATAGDAVAGGATLLEIGPLDD